MCNKQYVNVFLYLKIVSKLFKRHDKLYLYKVSYHPDSIQ